MTVPVFSQVEHTGESHEYLSASSAKQINSTTLKKKITSNKNTDVQTRSRTSSPSHYLTVSNTKTTKIHLIRQIVQLFIMKSKSTGYKWKTSSKWSNYCRTKHKFQHTNIEQREKKFFTSKAETEKILREVSEKNLRIHGLQENRRRAERIFGIVIVARIYGRQNWEKMYISLLLV